MTSHAFTAGRPRDRIDVRHQAFDRAWKDTMSDRIVHFEIPYDDEARARTFYGDLFG